MPGLIPTVLVEILWIVASCGSWLQCHPQGIQGIQLITADVGHAQQSMAGAEKGWDPNLPKWSNQPKRIKTNQPPKGIDYELVFSEMGQVS